MSYRWHLHCSRHPGHARYNRPPATADGSRFDDRIVRRSAAITAGTVAVSSWDDFARRFLPLAAAATSGG